MNFINKINRYLIERYPTLWNTKIVWMLGISLLVHILFFVIGYVSHNNPMNMQSSRVFEDYYTSGMIMVHIIISLLMMVGWLVFMFKNNAFKNFYPTSGLKLFGQFLCYIVIIFAGTTFYFSYMLGFQTYVKQTYPDSEMVKKVNIINQAYPFLSLDYQDYTLDKRSYPEEMKKLFCETNQSNIDYTKKYFQDKDNIYQFFTVYEVAVTERDETRLFKYPAKEYKNSTPLAYQNTVGDTCFYYFKKDVVDVSPYIKTSNLSYYNFSKVFFELDAENDDYDSKYMSPKYNNMYIDEPYVLNTDPSYRNTEFNKKLIGILDRKDPQEIKKIMSDFLEVSKEFEIGTNLDVDKWFRMVYHPDTFEVKRFINIYKEGGSLYPQQYDYEEAVAVPVDSAAAATVAITEAVSTEAAVAIDPYKENTNYNYFNKNLSKSYYEINNLRELLRNVELIKSSNVFENVLHVYLWIAFAFATLLFSFRVTNLRSVIFTGVTVGVLSLTIGLIVLLYTMSVGNKAEYFAGYLVLTIATIILLLPLLMMKSLPKLMGAVLMNISMNGFVLYVFLILGLISMHQSDACYDASYNRLSDCFILLEDLNLNTSYILFITGLLFMLCYTTIVKKWRAQPE